MYLSRKCVNGFGPLKLCKCCYCKRKVRILICQMDGGCRMAVCEVSMHWRPHISISCSAVPSSIQNTRASNESLLLNLLALSLCLTGIDPWLKDVCRRNRFLNPPVSYDLCASILISYLVLPSLCFQPGEGPSRGLLRDCEIIVNLRLKIYQPPTINFLSRWTANYSHLCNSRSEIKS